MDAAVSVFIVARLLLDEDDEDDDDDDEEEEARSTSTDPDCCSSWRDSLSACLASDQINQDTNMISMMLKVPKLLGSRQKDERKMDYRTEETSDHWKQEIEGEKEGK